LPANESKQFFIVHEGLLPVSAGHNQDIEGPGFRDSYVRVSRNPWTSRMGASSFPTAVTVVSDMRERTSNGPVKSIRSIRG
jgi:hypothetical protein